MIRRRIEVAVLCAFAALLIAPNLLVAFPGPTLIATGTSNAVDGYFEARPDEYGAGAQPFTTGGAGPNSDGYKPAGLPFRPLSFSSGMFLFVGINQRELLTDNTEWQATASLGVPFGNDTSLSRQVTQANIASDTNGDGVPDTLSSAFKVFNAAGTTNLQFSLTQKVQNVNGAVSLWKQSYTVTNNASTPISFTMLHNWDADMLWTTGDPTLDPRNDQVGTICNGAGMGQFSTQQEVGLGATAMTLSMGSLGRFYYGGRQGHTPTGGVPAMGFGTDVQEWEAFGVPTSWRNYIATVGYNTNGQSGSLPNSLDAFIGIDAGIDLAPGAQATLDVFHTLGKSTPVPEPASMLLLALGALAVRSRRR